MKRQKEETIIRHLCPLMPENKSKFGKDIHVEDQLHHLEVDSD